ncbi:acyltransferase [Leptospira congkakensis]|uniref:Acyltransferase n=1 Tax=Leptospira congkakensis TaxID=2484932 RepID=A0A4Z1AAU1_9LEPT|nr:acyltransferase [Leptospira congkakensis]TGL85083.1 acyltransferase [Leptospira congkakensis]TGL92795.1 acyltransferase [Leptospira congkakensis]TGL95532.1 acyltransferase [Leptospira congkakensis]
MFLWKALQSTWIRKHGENEALNGLRAIAILSVLFFHTVPSIGMIGWENTYFTKFLHTLDSGVALFFVLSGYLISNGLKREWLLNQKIDYKQFFIKRSLRIFPAYYFYLIITYLVVTAILQKGGENFSLSGNQSDPNSSLLMSYQNFKYDLIYLSDYFASYNIHTWSLAIEEKFYLFFPFVAGLLLFSLKGKNQGFTLLFLYLLPLVFRVFYYVSYGPNIEAFHQFHMRIDDLIAGIIVMEITNNQKIRKKLEEFKYHLLGFAFLIYVSNFILLVSENSFYKSIFSYNLYNLSFALFLVVAILGKNQFQKIMSIGFFRPIARLSYTMYLWNLLLAPVAFQSLAKPLKQNGFVTPIQFGMVTLQFFVYTFVFSMILYVLIEYPFLKWKSKLETK